jgi:small-conductance mechanosensitive channel
VRQTRTRVIITLKEACKQANISIPYPIRTLYYYNQEQEGNGFSASASFDSADR